MDASPQLRALLEAEGIALLVRFGSRARGTAAPGSDHDLALLRIDRRRLSYRQLRSLAAALPEQVGGRVDLVDLQDADALLRFEVVRDGQVIYQASPEIWTEEVARALIDHDDLAWFLPELLAGVGRAARAGGGP